MYNIKCHVTDCPMNFNVLLLHKPDKIFRKLQSTNIESMKENVVVYVMYRY